jgi:hypothetical protein
LSTNLYLLNNEKSVSNGILTSSEKSDERLHCFTILDALTESGFWATTAEEPIRSSTIEMFLNIVSKYRKYARD